MAGFKTFVDGVPLFASELNGFLMGQSVMRFATTTALVNALPSGIRETGMLAWADNTGVLYLFDGTNWLPWQSPEKSFSPIFTSGGTNITIGDGIVNSWWKYSGGLVQWNFRFVHGTTSNVQSGNMSISMPVATRAEHDWHILGQVSIKDQSAGTQYHRAAVTMGTTTSIAFVDSNSTRVAPGTPITFANNDQLNISARYLPSTGAYL